VVPEISRYKRKNVKKVVPDAANIAPCPTAGCCHLANWGT